MTRCAGKRAAGSPTETARPRGPSGAGRQAAHAHRVLQDAGGVLLRPGAGQVYHAAVFRPPEVGLVYQVSLSRVVSGTE